MIRHYTPTTWREIVAIEPAVADILVAAVDDNKLSDNPWLVYGRAKQSLSRLVGWHAERLELRTVEAYDAVIDVLIQALGV